MRAHVRIREVRDFMAERVLVRVVLAAVLDRDENAPVLEATLELVGELACVALRPPPRVGQPRRVLAVAGPLGP